MTYIVQDTDIFNCYMFTGSEYYAASGFLCFTSESNAGDNFGADNIAGPGTDKSTPDDTATLIRTQYGSIWNFWIYNATSTTALTSSSTTVDHAMVVGTRAGKGIVGRQRVVQDACT